MAVPVITSTNYDGVNVGTPYSYQIVATNSPTSYDASMSPSGLPAGLAIDTVTGILSGTPTFAGTYIIQLRAINGSGTGTRSFSLHIPAAGVPWLTSALSASGTVGTPFAYTITGSNSPTQFQITSLPPGLTVDTTTGVVSGTPTTVGNYNCKATVKNHFGQDFTYVTLLIGAGVGAPVVTNTELNKTIFLGTAFSYQITATNTPTSFNATPLPAGLSVNTGTGLITGTATATGTTAVTISATNGTGTGTADLSILVVPVGGGGNPPPLDIPRGIFAFIPVENETDAEILSNPNVSGISIGASWHVSEPVKDVYNFDYYRDEIIRIAPTGKKILLRPRTGSGSESTGGRVPDYVLSDMGVDPNDIHAVPGVTFNFDDQDGVVVIPVWWDPVFHARKKLLYQALGDWLLNTTELTPAEKDAVQIIAVSICNARTEDWNVPASPAAPPSTGGPDGTGYELSELDRWLHLPGDAEPGAGYTPQQIIDLGVQSDDSGIIDVAMAAFPGKYITLATNKNVVALDQPDNGIDGHYVPKTIVNAAYTKYPGRFITQRNNVSAVTPWQFESNGSTWELMGDLSDDEQALGGQALDAVWGDTVDTGGSGYRMNGGVDFDSEGILPPPLTAAQVLRQSANKLWSYNAFYYEIYRLDLLNQEASDLQYISELFLGESSGDIPVITSSLDETIEARVQFVYQITATNNPDSFAIQYQDGPTDYREQFNINTGQWGFTPRATGVYHFTVIAGNDSGVGTALLEITVIHGTGGGGEPPPPSEDPPPFTLVQSEAFPELSASAEADRDTCPLYADKFGGLPPTAVLDLDVVTPGTPSSGTATATWSLPIRI